MPPDNPFVGKAGARPEIFTYGHRDQLGLTVHPNGTVLDAEHGPNGGDEVNLILPGHNYGWPKSSFGRNYDGPRISPAPLGEGIEQPIVLWLPSIAPTGLDVLYGRQVPDVEGQPVRRQRTRRRDAAHGRPRARRVQRQARGVAPRTLLTDLHQRIRDVRQGPDGLLYVVTDEDDGALIRIEPAAL